MSTNYLLNSPVPLEQFERKMGESVFTIERDEKGEPFLTDGRNRLWLGLTPEGEVCCLDRYGASYVEPMVEAVSELLEVLVVSEHDDYYWELNDELEAEYAATHPDVV
jgi:hypothetical protein